MISERRLQLDALRRAFTFRYCGGSQLLRPGGIFCTQRCFWQAWRAFRRALAKGQLEDILEMPVSQEVLRTHAPATRRRQL